MSVALWRSTQLLGPWAQVPPGADRCPAFPSHGYLCFCTSSCRPGLQDCRAQGDQGAAQLALVGGSSKKGRGGRWLSRLPQLPFLKGQHFLFLELCGLNQDRGAEGGWDGQDGLWHFNLWGWGEKSHVELLPPVQTSLRVEDRRVSILPASAFLLLPGSASEPLQAASGGFLLAVGHDALACRGRCGRASGPWGRGLLRGGVRKRRLTDPRAAEECPPAPPAGPARRLVPADHVHPAAEPGRVVRPGRGDRDGPHLAPAAQHR